MTMHEGLVDQASKFKKRVASADTAAYKLVRRNQLVVGFPIDEGVLSFQDL
jgi:type I restriction enzyme S subunit